MIPPTTFHGYTRTAADADGEYTSVYGCQSPRACAMSVYLTSPANVHFVFTHERISMAQFCQSGSG